MAGARAEQDSDSEYQYRILPGVSRTFALTIPQLPTPLRSVVANAYLLCRIADTIEDDASLESERKEHFHERFCDVVSGTRPAEEFAAELYPLLGQGALPAERELIENTPRIVRITHSFNDRQRAAVERCINVMCRGMHHYQQNKSPAGLQSMQELDSYCYYVAGVVGEMLTELFCDYSPEIMSNRQALLRNAVAFGQGLQMTNILMDVWEDGATGTCWLPQDVFRDAGYDLRELSPDNIDQSFKSGMNELVGVAHAHLRRALDYTLTIPTREKGIRRFLLWAIGFAVLTLDNITDNPGFTDRAQVKVSRRAVKAVVVISNMSVRSNSMLNMLFNLSAKDLPLAESVLAPYDSQVA